MLFDERELNVLENNDAKKYFKEILQSYYSQNYRAAVVLLYSFVIYDLLIKLQTMANEGEKKAQKKLDEINELIKKEEKYSLVENNIIEFYTQNCPLYFNRFEEDIVYLKNCRNKCAHLKINDSSLFVPKDYQVRMLICSMYDNILSIKAPFITDLFSFVQGDVEKYTSQILFINRIDDSIYNDLTKKYFNRLTEEALKKSYATFIRLLFISQDAKGQSNIVGLYTFVYTLTKYIINNKSAQFIEERRIQDVFNRINISSIRDIDDRYYALLYIMVDFPIIMDSIYKNQRNIFDFMSIEVLSCPQQLWLYNVFFPREKKDVYAFFKENEQVQQPRYIDTLYETVKRSLNFDINDFMLIMVERIPNYNGFSDADIFTQFFISHLKEMNKDSISKVLDIYDLNGQCVNRGKHKVDMEKIEKYLNNSNEKE